MTMILSLQAPLLMTPSDSRIWIAAFIIGTRSELTTAHEALDILSWRDISFGVYTGFMVVRVTPMEEAPLKIYIACFIFYFCFLNNLIFLSGIIWWPYGSEMNGLTITWMLVEGQLVVTWNGVPYEAPNSCQSLKRLFL